MCRITVERTRSEGGIKAAATGKYEDFQSVNICKCCCRLVDVPLNVFTSAELIVAPETCSGILDQVFKSLQKVRSFGTVPE